MIIFAVEDTFKVIKLLNINFCIKFNVTIGINVVLVF